MALKVKEVDLWDILSVNFAKIHSMEIMSCTCICPLNIILAIYAKGKYASVYEKVVTSLKFKQTYRPWIQFTLFIAGAIQDNMSTTRIMMTWRPVVFCVLTCMHFSE